MSRAEVVALVVLCAVHACTMTGGLVALAVNPW